MGKFRMRYSEKCVEELKKIDPDTPISRAYILKLAHEGKIPSVKGQKGTLISFDGLLEYLDNLGCGNDDAPIARGIRRVEE